MKKLLLSASLALALASPAYAGCSLGTPQPPNNLNASQSVTTPGAISATITGVANQTNLTGFEITGGGATAGSVIAATVTNVVGGTLTFWVAIPAGVSTQVNQTFAFACPIQSTGAGGITVSVPSFGAGSVGQAVNVHGY